MGASADTLPSSTHGSHRTPRRCAGGVIDLGEGRAGLELRLVYGVFADTDTITRRVVLSNAHVRPVTPGTIDFQQRPIDHQFSGTEYHSGLRMLGDHGSTLYVVDRLEEDP